MEPQFEDAIDGDDYDEARIHDAEEPSLFRFQDEEEIMSYDDWA